MLRDPTEDRARIDEFAAVRDRASEDIREMFVPSASSSAARPTTRSTACAFDVRQQPARRAPPSDLQLRHRTLGRARHERGCSCEAFELVEDGLLDEARFPRLHLREPDRTVGRAATTASSRGPPSRQRCATPCSAAGRGTRVAIESALGYPDARVPRASARFRHSEFEGVARVLERQLQRSRGGAAVSRLPSRRVRRRSVGGDRVTATDDPGSARRSRRPSPPRRASCRRSSTCSSTAGSSTTTTRSRGTGLSSRRAGSGTSPSVSSCPHGAGLHDIRPRIGHARRMLELGVHDGRARARRAVAAAGTAERLSRA